MPWYWHRFDSSLSIIVRQPSPYEWCCSNTCFVIVIVIVIVIVAVAVAVAVAAITTTNNNIAPCHGIDLIRFNQLLLGNCRCNNT